MRLHCLLKKRIGQRKDAEEEEEEERDEERGRRDDAASSLTQCPGVLHRANEKEDE